MFSRGAPGHFSQVFSWSSTCWKDIKLLLTRTWRNSDFLIAPFIFFNFFFSFLVQAAGCFGLLKKKKNGIAIWKSGSLESSGWEGSRPGGWGRAEGGFAEFPGSWDLRILGSGVGIVGILFFLIFLKLFLRQGLVVESTG